MSIEKTAPRNVPTRSADGNIELDQAVELKLSTIDKIEVTSLQIDESYDVDCDPYNRTGQFLVDAVKKKLSD